ncbi:hypothetical protein D9M71_743720 [compost metagenome]
MNRFFPAETLRDETEYIYAPLGACKAGIDNIKKQAPRINICQAELINDENQFFTGLTKRYKELNGEFVENLKSTYIEFLDKVGLTSIKNKFGYGDLELTFAYAHGTPNATLPIFWAANENYQPIFSR